jgi:hypothetical protein
MTDTISEPDDETPESYSRGLRAAFEGIAGELQSALSGCIGCADQVELSHLNFVIYPETFTECFAVYVWAIRSDRTMVSLSVGTVFKEEVRFKLLEKLDPYNIDREWRSELFFKLLCELFHGAWKALPGTGGRWPMYLMTPDAPRSWSITECKEIEEEDKFRVRP